MFSALKRLWPAPRLSPRQAEGRAAESAARRYLEERGYHFRAANYRTPQGEVDLIMEKAGTVVFVEVRARGRTDYGRPEETVTPQKQKKIARAALRYVKAHRREKSPLRFDVVALAPEGLTHIENAFAPPAGTYHL